MKLLYIADARIPTEKAHGIQIMKTCEALARAGAEVELLIPQRLNSIKTNPFKYYGVKEGFKITKLWVLDLVGILPKLGFWIESLTFAERVFWYAFFKRYEVIYSRDILPLYYLSLWKENTFWEAHRGSTNFMIRRLVKRCRGIITISQALKELYLKMGAESEKVLVAPDAVDLKEFAIPDSRLEIRKKLGLPSESKIIMYTGHLYDWKGASVLLSVALNAKFKNQNAKFVFVGGTQDDVKKFCEMARGADNVLLLGHKPHQEIPKYLAAADVLVLPNSAKAEISRLYTSPLKLFEYLASCRPIVAADLPSLREILTEETAVFFVPDEAKSLAEAVGEVLQNPDLSARIIRNGWKLVQNFTWEKRAQKIIEFLNLCYFR